MAHFCALRRQRPQVRILSGAPLIHDVALIGWFVRNGYETLFRRHSSPSVRSSCDGDTSIRHDR